MNIDNIQTLAENLSRLGFTTDLRNQLLFYACLKQKEFGIRDRKVFGNDTVSYQLFFRRYNQTVICTHYDASLRRQIVIDPKNEIGARLESVEDKMKAVNWKRLSQFDSVSPVSFNDKKTWEEQLAAEAVISELEALSVTTEGKKIADILKYKYWVDLPLESFIPDLLLLKGRLELSQRFYITDNDGITTEEAFRFLNNRWIQRQMQATKKIGSNTGNVSQPSDSAPVHRGVKKVLKKKSTTKK